MQGPKRRGEGYVRWGGTFARWCGGSLVGEERGGEVFYYVLLAGERVSLQSSSR